MDRRSFFRTMVGGVATAAAVRTWPFRVYSFPSQPILGPGDFIIPYSQWLEPGQMIGAYDSDGGLNGVYRVKHVDVVGKIIYIAHEAPLDFGIGSSSSWEKGSDGTPRRVGKERFDTRIGLKFKGESAWHKQS